MFRSLPKRPLVLAALTALAIPAVAYAALPGTPVGPRFSCPSGTLVAIGDQVSCRVEGAGPQTTQSTDAICTGLPPGILKSRNPDAIYAVHGQCFRATISCNENELAQGPLSTPACPPGQVCNEWQVDPQRGPNDRDRRVMCVRTASAAGFVAPVAK